MVVNPFENMKLGSAVRESQAAPRSAVVPDGLRPGDAEVRAVILINLLPHREEKRRQRKKSRSSPALAVAAVVGLAIVGVWYAGAAAADLGAAGSATTSCKAEIAKLEVQIKDIASLRPRSTSLKARQKAVEDLQTDRNMPVHLLNELVKQTPEGVYLTAIKQDGQVRQRHRHRADQRARLRVPAQHRLQLRRGWSKPELVEIKAATIRRQAQKRRRLAISACSTSSRCA